MNHERTLSLSMRLAALLVVALACAACAATTDEDESTEETSAALSRGGLGADGDACSIANPDGTKAPGTEKGLDCCRTAFPYDCIVILKPFPGLFRRSAR